MKKCKITILKTELYEDLCAEYMPNCEVCPVMKKGDVFITGGPFGNSMPEGFCDWAWTAIENIAWTLAGGGKVLGQDYNIACCNDGIRPVVMKLEAVDE